MSKLKLEDTRSPDEWSITEANLERKLANKEQLVLLDVRDRAAFAINHRDGARNIPLDELPVRAQNELALDHTIVICGSDPSEAALPMFSFLSRMRHRLNSPDKLPTLNFHSS
jgi:hypothetical protein